MSIRAMEDGILYRPTEKIPKHSKVDSTFTNLFSCIICKGLAIANNPDVQQCCSGVVGYRQCLGGWLDENPTCPNVMEKYPCGIS